MADISFPTSPASPAAGVPRVAMRGITKRFHGVLALDDVRAIVSEVIAAAGELNR